MKIFKKIAIIASSFFLIYIILCSYLWVRMINEVQSVTVGDEAFVCYFDVEKAERFAGESPNEVYFSKTYIKGEKIHTITEEENGKHAEISTASGNVYSWGDDGINEYYNTDEKWFNIWPVGYLGKRQGSVEILRSSVSEDFNAFAFHTLPLYINYYYFHNCYKEKIDEDLMSIPGDVRFFERTSYYKSFDCDGNNYLSSHKGRRFFYEGEVSTAFKFRLSGVEEVIMIKEKDGFYVSEDERHVFKEEDEIYLLEKNGEVVYSGCEMLEDY